MAIKQATPGTIWKSACKWETHLFNWPLDPATVSPVVSSLCGIKTLIVFPGRSVLVELNQLKLVCNIPWLIIFVNKDSCNKQYNVKLADHYRLHNLNLSLYSLCSVVKMDCVRWIISKKVSSNYSIGEQDRAIPTDHCHFAITVPQSALWGLLNYHEWSNLH